MRKFIKKTSHKTGLPPGALVHVGTKKMEKTKITLIDYNETTIEEKELETIEECFSCKDTSTVTWINIDGVYQTDIIETIGKHLELHGYMSGHTVELSK